MGIAAAGLNVFLYPLQSYQMSDFWKAKSASSSDALVFVIVVAVAIAVLIAFNIVRKKYNIPALNGTASAAPPAAHRHYSGFALRRAAREIGLDRKHTKMLDFVFKNGGAADVESSMNSPALLDQYFKRAYRLIDKTSRNETETQERLSLLFSTRNILEAGGAIGHISSTRQIPDNTATMLGFEQQSYPTRVLSAKGEHLQVDPPKNASGSAIKLPKGSKVILSFFTKSSSGFSFESRALGFTESKDGTVLQLLHSSQMKRLSQRRFRRRQSVIACGFFFVYAGEGNKKPVVDKRRLTGNILDLSIGGCSIKANAPVNSGSRLKIEFTQENTTAAALGQVLRTNRSGGGVILHIKFIKIPRKSMNMINAFVYEYAD